MAKFGKKDKKSEKTAPKVAVKSAQPKKPYVPADEYTLFLGLAALFLLIAVGVLGWNFYDCKTSDPPVIPMSWAK